MPRRSGTAAGGSAEKASDFIGGDRRRPREPANSTSSPSATQEQRNRRLADREPALDRRAHVDAANVAAFRERGLPGQAPIEYDGAAGIPADHPQARRGETTVDRHRREHQQTGGSQGVTPFVLDHGLSAGND